MKILGIIVEYNPFHTGHLYHLQKAKEMVKPDLTIAIMSGNYVQREEVAIIDKFKRSELAIKYGVDLFIELPFAYVCQSADYFCKGAIDLLYHIGITDLVFGSECGDILIIFIRMIFNSIGNFFKSIDVTTFTTKNKAYVILMLVIKL